MKTILVATDFSFASTNAARYAAEMALAINAGIFLLHVYPVPVSYTEIPVAVDLEDLQQSAEEEITNLKELLNILTDDKLQITSLVKRGSFFPELELICEEIKPYTVVMGSQGTTAAERLFFGGHAVYSMKNLLWPLITVPPEARFSTVKKIGLACDFNEAVDAIPTDEIIKLVRDFKAELTILNTGRQEVYNPEIVYQSGWLQEMLLELKPEFHFITNKNTDEGIMDFAMRNDLDLLIVLPKRYGLLEGLMHHSHAKQLVLHSHVPVLALHTVS